ncbi:hypothetical protein BDQ17DRAFT_1340416, partial [Cyathus striatus]
LSSFRAVARTAPRRSFATADSSALQAFEAESKALQHHATVAVCTAWVYNAEAEHAAHLQHIRDQNGGELPEVPAFDFLNRRGKPFPWGQNSLFFNPHVNKNLEE